jgi:hypothetical protein
MGERPSYRPSELGQLAVTRAAAKGRFGAAALPLSDSVAR